MSIVEKNINSKLAPILIPVFGFGIQGVLWFIVFTFTILSHNDSNGNVNPVSETISLIGAYIVFFMPFLSLIGIFLSIRNIIKKEYITLNILALALNLVWLGLLILALWMVFVLKVSA